MSKNRNDILHPRVRDALERYEIEHRVLECDPALADTAEFCAHYGFKLDQSANTIIVAGKGLATPYAACVVLATTKLDVNKKVRELIGAKRVSFARMDDAIKASGMEFGGITAIGLPAAIPVYIDTAIMEQQEVIMGGGNRNSKLCLEPRELRKLPTIEIVEGLAHPK